MSSTKPSTPAEILNAFYDAERQYVHTPSPEHEKLMLSFFSPDIVLHQTPALPYGGEYHGIDRFQEWGRRMSEYFDVLDVREPEFYENQGSGRVVVLSTLRLRVRKTGQVLENPMAQSVTVDLEKGVITDVRPFVWDVAGVNAALGV